MLDLSPLEARQNLDGGWGYRKGSSWTEPTTFALLALAASGEADSTPARKGLEWLGRAQRSDGGWAPRASVEESTWVTALVLLLPDRWLTEVARGKARRWLLESTGRESSWVQRIRNLMTNGQMPPPSAPVGWPWFADTAAWVIPTCFSILALEKAYRSHPSSQIGVRCESARQFLFSRRCRDGGWNHGANNALGYDSGSYPETTGLALLALHGVNSNSLDASLTLAHRQVETTSSLEAGSWLRLGLLSHGHQVAGMSPRGHGGTQETSVAVLADAAATRGRNIFLD
jgi:hypothetical protein